MEKPETLGARAKARRKALGLRQEDVAELCGLGQGDVSKIERSLILEPTKLVGLAQALQCDPTWLSTGEGQMETERVWPFLNLKYSQVKNLLPEDRDIVEKLAVRLHLLHKQQVDAGPTGRDTVGDASQGPDEVTLKTVRKTTGGKGDSTSEKERSSGGGGAV